MEKSSSNKINELVKKFGLPRIIIAAFFVLLMALTPVVGLKFGEVVSDVIRRWAMYGILVLAMVPGVQCGIGLNFGVSLGIVAGLIGATTALELEDRFQIANPWMTFSYAMLISIPIAILLGYIYGLLLNKVKGSEMTVSTYVGFSAIALANIVWLILPFKSGTLIWPLQQQGLRNTVNLSDSFGQLLSNPAVVETQPAYLRWLAFKVPNSDVVIPFGLILFFLFTCWVVWLFLRSKTGLAMSATGENQAFTISNGIKVNDMRILGTVVSTVLGAIGIIIYAQAYGFVQLYNAPLMMAFQCVAAVLIGGATTRKATIINVIVGTLLFQGILTTALPVMNKLLPASTLSEVLRIIITNGIILYALSKTRGGNQVEK